MFLHDLTFQQLLSGCVWVEYIIQTQHGYLYQEGIIAIIKCIGKQTISFLFHKYYNHSYSPDTNTGCSFET